jgi:PAS domain S-box-containing protein
MNAPLPANEAERLDALRRYAILDSPPEQDFDELVSLASQICRTPIAAISLIDADRQWLKAKVGLTSTQTPRAIAFCAHTILQPDLFVVRDAMADARFSGNPLVTADPHIRFYAGMPLIASNGHALGSLCVIDRVPRQLTPEQAEALRALSRQVVSQLELRRTQHLLQQSVEREREVHQREEAVTTLETVEERVASKVGEEFFVSLVSQLAAALGVDYAYLSELSEDGTYFRSKAGWGKGQPLPPFNVPERGPCETVLSRRVVHHPDQLHVLYPHVQIIQDIGAVSYCGVPVIDASDSVAGHLAIMDTKPMLDSFKAASVLSMFATRAAAEIERVRMGAEVRRGDLILRSIDEGTATAVGERFFQSLVKNLALALGVRYTFIAQLADSGRRVRTLAFWKGTGFASNVEYALSGTPCEKVLCGQVCHYAQNVQAVFPEDQDLVALDAQSYLAIPLVGSGGKVLGHLAALDVNPMPLRAELLSVFKIFGARAGAELERTHMEAALKESEERLRDLFDEAPIAYVHEGLDTRFIRANRAAMRSLGIKPEEIAGTYGKSFIPDTPDAQRRLREALESIGRGTDTSGVVLELRRKDNGKPLWIQWWSKPDPSGAYTRTMFLDITDRVLMEQEKARLEAQKTYLQEEIQTKHNFEEVIGTAPAIKKVLRAVEQVATTDATVLITGETGTGKELIARAIHNLSPRKQGVLVKVNCAAIPAGLIESELFGHEKGAFTGALARKIGRFELADRATIFLDEVGEVPVDLQTKLLRVLQEGEFERLGSTKTIKVNVRVVAATNRDLEREVREGRVRSDLYYRLNVFPIHLPPLRDRKQDIPLLATYFIKKYAADLGKKIETIAHSAMETLKAYPWPGNIRELEHVIERAVILSQGPQLELGEWLPKPRATSDAAAPTTLEEVERAHILATLEGTGWRVSGENGAAKLLGLKPTTLEARMQKLGITRKARGTGL